MRKLERDRSGQILILTALAVAFIISSTMVYIYQASQVSSEGHPSSAEKFVRIIRLGSQNLVIGSLSNISNGGDNQTLGSNLERWGSFVEKQYYFGECSLSFNLSEISPYYSGLYFFWGQGGFGVSSAKADFSLNLTDKDTEITVDYSVNVTTSIRISAVSKWELSVHRINVTIFLYNEGEPALAENLTVYYQEKGGGWMDAGELDSFLLEDFGNGTYIASFTVGPPRTQNRGIKVSAYDRRGIYVEASTTSTDV